MSQAREVRPPSLLPYEDEIGSVEGQLASMAYMVPILRDSESRIAVVGSP